MTQPVTDNAFRDQNRAIAAKWKASTSTLTDAARAPGPFIGSDGGLGGGALPFCLPRHYASFNLLPDVREQALSLFKELAIPWHNGIDGGPNNHLLDSQVQCVNALARMVDDPERSVRAFGGFLDIAEVLPIEPERMLTFEYIGPRDYFREGSGKPRVRGTRCTSLDAAFMYRTSHGQVELALVEWKFTENYLQPPNVAPKQQISRRERYSPGWEDADGPLRTDVIPFDDMLVEPFYQLMRQQLLAHTLEMDPDVPAAVVRVLHVLSPDNDFYQRSLTRPSHEAAGSTVGEAWQRLLRNPDRYRSVDPTVFLDPAVTSEEYVRRYGLHHHGGDAIVPPSC